MTRKKLSLDGSMFDVIHQMSEGNPGAINVLMQILQADKQAGFMTILSLDDMNMRGPQIWIGFKDHCNQDLAAFTKAIQDRDPAMVATVNASRGTAPGTPAAVTGGASFQHEDRAFG